MNYLSAPFNDLFCVERWIRYGICISKLWNAKHSSIIASYSAQRIKRASSFWLNPWWRRLALSFKKTAHWGSQLPPLSTEKSGDRKNAPTSHAIFETFVFKFATFQNDCAPTSYKKAGSDNRRKTHFSKTHCNAAPKMCIRHLSKMNFIWSCDLKSLKFYFTGILWQQQPKTPSFSKDKHTVW